MAMTGLQVYKMLPKTNCAKCGYSTCLAFGMALCAGKEKLDKCPSASEELRALFEAESKMPIAEVSFGVGESSLTIGGEKVLYRHDESFFNQTCIAISIESSISDKALDIILKEASELKFIRAGVEMKVNSFALFDTLNDGSFGVFAKKLSGIMPLILISENVLDIESAIESTFEQKPLIYCKNADIQKKSEWAKKYSVPLVVDTIEESEQLGESVNTCLLLQGSLKDIYSNSVKIRSSAVLQKKSAPPVISFLHEIEDAEKQILHASFLINRYVSALVLSITDKNLIMPLLTLRQNIYTDPRKPVQVEPGIYPIGNPSETSPVLITTNFSLTQFLVSGEIEASRIPAWLLVIDTDGTSLLTAWAADKFNGERIAKAIKKYGLEDKVKHKRAVISAYVSGIKDEIEKASSWEIEIGPADSQGISPWLKRFSNV